MPKSAFGVDLAMNCATTNRLFFISSYFLEMVLAYDLPNRFRAFNTDKFLI